MYRLILAGLGLVGVIILPRVVTSNFAAARIARFDAMQAKPTVLVFGAGLRRDGKPTAVLRERVATAAALFSAGKAQRLLMSGHAPEPEAMRILALQLGVPDEAILVDNGGLRTYDSCYRAVDVFGVRQAFLVTQSFHLPRALYTCAALGLNGEGVVAEGNRYRKMLLLFWEFRETLATFTAMWDIHISKPVPEFNNSIQ